MRLSVIIPVFNEEKTIEEILQRVAIAKLPKDWEKEIIIIDDGSTDESFIRVNSQAAKLKSKNILFIILRNDKNCGKGLAIRRGISRATGDVLIVQDADLEYNPDDYERLLGPLIAGKAKVIYGSRLKTLKLKLKGEEKTPFPLHYFANRLLSGITNLLYNSSLTDMETGYKIMTKEVFKKLDLVSQRFEIEPEITAKILKLGYKITEVPIETKPRGYQEGKKIKSPDALKAVLTLFRYRFMS